MKKGITHRISRLAIVLLMGICSPAMAQLGIGTSSPDASAKLDIVSKDQGVLLPRMSFTDMDNIASPATGLLVYCTTCTPAGLHHYNGSNWVPITDLTYQSSNFSAGDNLGNHTATQTLKLRNNKIVGGTVSTDGTDGISIAQDGGVTFGNGAAVKAFSNRDDLAGENASDDSVATQKAVRTFFINNDGLGDHTAGANIKLQNHKIVGTNGTEGISVATDGGVTFGNGAAVKAFSTNPNLGGSNDSVATQSAVRSYVNNNRGLIDEGSGNLHGGGNLQNVTTGYGNLALGGSVLGAVTTGLYNTSVGAVSGTYLTTGNYNTFMGVSSGRLTSTGSNNVAMGMNTLFHNGTGAGNTAIGAGAGNKMTNASYNVLMGYQTATHNLNSYNTMIGAQAGLNSNTTASVYLGFQAGFYDTLGGQHLWIANTGDVNLTPLVGGDFVKKKVGINMHIDSLNQDGRATFQVGGDIQLLNGTKVNEFSVQTDLGAGSPSDNVVSTQKAVKAYVDNTVKPYSTRSDLAGANASDDSVATQKAVKAYVDNTVKPYSTRSDLAGANASDDSVATQKAVKAFVDNTVKPYSTRDDLAGANASDDSVATQKAVKTFVHNTVKPYSTRGDLAGTNASDDSVATQKAVKAYVDGLVSGPADNLGNHQASQNIDLAGNTLVGNGGSKGIKIDINGGVSFGDGTGIKAFSTRTDLAGANASDDSVATQKAVKAYVDGNRGLITTTIGTNNVHSGQGNMNVNLTANAADNIAIGYQALENLKEGDQNIAIGGYALKGNEDGLQNVALGQNALFNNKLGHGNFALGSDAGFMSTGSGNVFIGNGAGLTETGDSTLYIDYYSTASSTPFITGSFKTGANRRFGINRKQSDLNGRSELFQLGGEAYKTSGSGSWIISSDRRLKTNIRNLNSDEMLQKVLNMRGVTYEWNDTVTGADRPQGIQYGFIAQEIEEVWPTKINRDKQGYLATAYGEYDPVFVESIKALHTRIAELEKENGELRKDMETMQSSQQDMHALKDQVNKLQEIISELAARDFYAEK